MSEYGTFANIILHSESPNGEQLITMEVDFHRFILAEVNTHRVLSRNYQSSRAMPILRQLEQIANSPAMPLYWGKNQAGMQAKEEITGLEREMAEMIILGMRDACLNGVKQLQKLGLHKQTANRYVEPWMYTKGIITASLDGWNSLLKLRLHKDAQPEFKVLAEKIKKAIDNSVPNKLNYGEWHLPYIEEDCKLSLLDKVKVSSSCCAQVSFRNLDDSIEKAIKIYDMLNLPEQGEFKEDPPHFSPVEHCALCLDPAEYFTNGGNFNGMEFYQYRKMLEIGVEEDYIKEFS